MIHGIVTGSYERLCERVREYAEQNHIDDTNYYKLLRYVKEQHLICKGFPEELYNLNHISVTCRAWEDRWYEGK